MKTDLSTNTSETKKKSHPFWKWFWLSFLVCSLAYAWYSFYAPSNDVKWQKDMATAQKIAEESDKNIMLFFTAEWCSPCHIMKREVFADETVSNIINSKVVPVIIDVDDPKMADVVKLYEVGVTPVTIFTDAEGEVIDYAVGKINKKEFLKMLGM